MLVDKEEGSFSELDADLQPSDPLKFSGNKPYEESLKQAQESTGLMEAVLTGIGKINGFKVALGVLDFSFIGGSMGSVVGEKIARLFAAASREGLPVITVSSSGGARMQEGVFSLMQMAKTAAAVQQFSQTKLPYISVLANPTTGGVLASFSSLADIIIAEPHALIGFAGPRVIEQTLNQKVPKGFQSAETVLKNGFIDLVVERKELRPLLVNLLSYLT
jgi:acetyl-CoA carboxylase carboxyl transferase subunit beta